MPDVSVNGWSYLSLKTNSLNGKYDDYVQALAAGYLEGYLTQEMIWDSKYNYYTNYFNSSTIPKVLNDWLTENYYNMHEFIVNNVDSWYWRQLNLTLTQMNGLLDGYTYALSLTNNRSKIHQQTIVLFDLFVLNMYGDLGDLGPALHMGNFPAAKRASDFNDIQDYFMKTQHCSALIKLTSDYSELYAAHTTWTGYNTMLRIFKSYNYGYSFEYSGTISRRNMFSSYPGVLISIDDFYQMADTNLVVLETTNSLLNPELYKLIRPYSGVLSWIRITITNRLSNDGKSWCETFSRYNSGTYNNQYMVIDYKKFTPYKELKDGALYVLEQIPEYIEYDDQTVLLREMYFSSFNIPFYETIYNMSGYNNFTSNNYTNSKIYYLSYQTCPRSEIFRRDVGSIESLDSFKALLRYNKFQTDPLSHGTPFYAICSRYDLLSDDPKPFGCTDTKVTSYNNLLENSVLAISGPTTDNQKPFVWSSNSNFMNVAHNGIPNEFNFDWVVFKNNSFNNY
ncbi:hypothetical protein DICPUDRAFT_46100 [Dictyostelium purpureum]|uniref:Phospholipase B-like n=1 Tax=Dictyostelium purpureum TaxID=5786 RepID=F0ZDH9_DICPU|nr:uncharacterized protein DICPUDRAFT_46100 [Dictyostelium purpureum]EGC38000.1 hypothetical protein DICPUDRAFT_46100 [Dictyostelium purpureum]|eukprot:XP_003285484.1 hypothetical protein DICPUDRAFT_46100 [Dictyostelium purpureum]